nr:hypothetical protein [Tanacetum cinerariifolium]
EGERQKEHIRKSAAQKSSDTSPSCAAVRFPASLGLKRPAVTIILLAIVVQALLPEKGSSFYIAREDTAPRTTCWQPRPVGPSGRESYVWAEGDAAAVGTAVTVARLPRRCPENAYTLEPDTIQLEDTVSTISKEYLLEFTSEYSIPESLHPELPGPEEPIVEFPEGKVGVYTKFFEFANFTREYSPPSWNGTQTPQRIRCHQQTPIPRRTAPNPTRVKTGTRPRAAHEVPLLTATASRVIDIEDTADGLSHEIPPVGNKTTMEVVLEPGLEKEVAAMGPLVNKRRHKRGNDEAKTNAPPKVLRKGHAAVRPAQSTLGGKSLAPIGLDAGSIFSTPATQDAPTVAKSVSDPDPLSYVKPQSHPERNIAQSSRKTTTEIPTENVANPEVQGLFSAESLESEKSTSFPSVDGSPGAREEEIKKLDQEIKSLRAVEAEVHGLHNQTKNLETLLEAEVSNLQAQVTGEEKIKGAFEEFKKYEDDRDEQRCAEMDARLDKLKVDFDEELYPHMLTAIAGRRWVIGHGLRLAVMKCAESPELRQAFANVVST